MDITVITGALTSIKTILDISKTLQDQKIVSAINSAVADVQVKLIEAQQQIMAVQDENRSLKETLAEVHDHKSLEALVSFHDAAYWKKREDGKEDGPYCPSCWDLNRKLVVPAISDSNGRVALLFCSHHSAPRRFSVPVHLVRHLNPRNRSDD
jgi:hypothetical protein